MHLKAQMDACFCLAQLYEGELIVDWNEKIVDEYCSGIRTGSNKGTYTLDVM